jgi:hypothetical protein
MSRMVSRGRIAPVVAVLLGLVVLGMLALTVVFDSLTHYPGTGGPLVAAFTARMRQTVDFDGVRDDLAGVVHEAFQPTQVSIWLVEAGSPEHALGGGNVAAGVVRVGVPLVDGHRLAL